MYSINYSDLVESRAPVLRIQNRVDTTASWFEDMRKSSSLFRPSIVALIKETESELRAYSRSLEHLTTFILPGDLLYEGAEEPARPREPLSSLDNVIRGVSEVITVGKGVLEIPQEAFWLVNYKNGNHEIQTYRKKLREAKLLLPCV